MVEAYWVGNDLLDRVALAELGAPARIWEKVPTADLLDAFSTGHFAGRLGALMEPLAGASTAGEMAALLKSLPKTKTSQTHLSHGKFSLNSPPPKTAHK